MGYYSIDYEMRCRNCGEGKQLPQRSIAEDKEDFSTDNRINSEYKQADYLAKILKDCDVNCDWCDV